MKRDTKKALIGMHESRYLEGRKQKQELVRQWYINIAYLVGYQWLYWNTVTRRLEMRYTPKNRVRAVSNQILPIFSTAVAKLTKNPPKFNTGASTKDPNDIVSAATARKILNHYWRFLELESEADLFCSWLTITGNAFMLVDWDRQAGAKIPMPLTFDPSVGTKFAELPNPTTGMPYQPGEPMINPETNQPFMVEMNEGEPICKVVSPFEISIPVGTEQFDNAAWLGRDQEMSESEIKAIFGEKAAKSINFELKDKSSPVEKSIFTKLHNLMGTRADAEDSIHGPSATIFQTWDKPLPGESKGVTVISCGSEILHKGTFDYDKTKYPIKHACYYRIPGIPWGRGLIEDEIPLQRQYNVRLSQIQEAINEISRPKILMPSGSQVSPLSFTKSAGEHITYNPLGGKPEYLNTGDLPQSVFTDLENIKKDMQQVAGLHEVSHADVPASVRSGVAISFLQDTDDTRLGKITRRVELTYDKTGKSLLYQVQQNVQEPRLGKVIGEDREIEVFMFKGSDISDSVDVYVQSGSAFPQNQLLKQEHIKGLFDSGLLPPDVALKLLEMEGALELRQDTLLDMRCAKMENQMMSEGGQPIQPMPFEDIHLHLEIHGSWLKANKFSQNPGYEVVLDHYMMTYQMLMMVTQQQPGQEQEQQQQEGGQPSPTQ